MLHQFLSENESVLVERCRVKSRRRSPPASAETALNDAVAVFLRELIRTLAIEQIAEFSTPIARNPAENFSIGKSAASHGRDLLDRGCTIDQVVHAYGDVCQSITDLAFECGEAFQVVEFRILNRCLDIAIADAVTEFSYQRESTIGERLHKANIQQLGFVVHELRNLIQTANLAFAAIKIETGGCGATSDVLERTLSGLKRIVDSAISEVRGQANVAGQTEVFPLAEFIDEIQVSASLQAREYGCLCSFSSVDPALSVCADRHLLCAAICNLLQNAFKFTHPDTEVSLRAYGAADRVLIDVADHCGGLADRELEQLCHPHACGDRSKSGLGLGLTIARRSVEANNGILKVRDRPNEGCIFTIDLPRYAIRSE